MRFLHTADWHIGKKLHGYDLLTEQRDAYEQIKAIAIAEKVDAVVIAGDLYDRALPSEDAVSTLDTMLVDLNRHHHFPLLAISGNHDSAVRLSQGSEWFSSTDFYLNTRIADSVKPVVLGDTQFFLLPYFEPFAVRQYFGDDSIKTVAAGMERLVAAMQEQFAPDKKHVLIAHFFAAGSQHSDSETLVQVGGLNAVPVDLLNPFDYVALGHLHRKEALQNEPTMKYSGSPLKFSTSEAEDTKGVWIVDTDQTPVSVTFKPLKPLNDLVVLTDSFARLMDSEVSYSVKADDFIAIELTDTTPIANVMQRLKTRFPRIIELQRVNQLDVTPETLNIEEVQRDPLTLLDDFFETVTDHALTTQQEDWAKQALQQAMKEDK
ncbi:exonuclease SbcCD subunit D [Levilactobacillus parabrevis]|uniref:Nuclease SbcCD subunit D n=1 Tax=Levilactobacillus parabrevis ATCC 53295 TaxID=1267003 RepID=A0A0R1GSA9_9LACO|nr:exonuclease SbcCD subunit D [Levilactobacillus parabrevis]KRK36760.1 DNA repair exonuclease [Levilactobacillus parabrevis ATCC 53295]KRO05995.1 DNA repair exonuclease [Levilactobacillus parabrevis]